MELALLRSSASRIGAALRDQTVMVPAHFDAEVFAAVRRLVRRKLLTAERAMEALFFNERLTAERVALVPLYPDAFRLRDTFGSSDVFYVVLARRLGATLLTSDSALAASARGFIDVRYEPAASSR